MKLSGTKIKDSSGLKGYPIKIFVFISPQTYITYIVGTDQKSLYETHVLGTD